MGYIILVNLIPFYYLTWITPTDEVLLMDFWGYRKKDVYKVKLEYFYKDVEIKAEFKLRM